MKSLGHNDVLGDSTHECLEQEDRYGSIPRPKGDQVVLAIVATLLLPALIESFWNHRQYFQHTSLASREDAG